MHNGTCNNYNYCFPLANEEILNKENLIDIIDALKKGGFTTTNWHKLGLRLSISHNDLTIIEHNYPNDVVRCLEECLVKWLKTGKATYTELAEALKKMGENAAADHISSVKEERSENRSVLGDTLSDISGSVKEERQEKRRLLGK